jgi:hypothetical protein
VRDRIRPQIALLALIATAILTPITLPAPASAGATPTIDAILRRDCANGGKAGDLEAQGLDALDLAQFSAARQYYRKAAALEYHCAKGANDSYAHDWYLLYYAKDLYESAPDKDGGAVGIAYAAANNLAAATQYVDVSKAALRLRDALRKLNPSLAE